MPPTLTDPDYLVMEAQQANIARIDSGVVLLGTDGNGDQIELFGPTPDLILMWDEPIRLIEDSVLQGWERIITIRPSTNNIVGANTARTDRVFLYTVFFLVRLNQQEISADRAKVVTDGVRARNSLAQKVHKLKQDFHHVFYDNLNLITDDCPSGVVNHAQYNLRYSQDLSYPQALFMADISCEINAG
jgi:hypothetical protein